MKKLLYLLPVFCITGCIGANWQVDIKRAKTVATKILAAQEDDNFSIFNSGKHFFIENTYFELTDRYNENGEQVDVVSNFYLSSYLLNYEDFTFFSKKRDRYNVEGHESSSDDISSRWIYVKDNVLYDVIDTGKKDGRTYTRHNIDEPDEVGEYFTDYVATVFDLESIDCKNSAQLDIDFIQRTVDELDVREDAKSAVKYFSRQEGTLSHRVDNEYIGYHEESKLFSPNGHDKSGRETMFYGWENNLYVNKEINSNIEYSFDGKVVRMTINETYKCVTNATNGSLKDNDANYNKDYVFNFPKLSEYVEK